MRDKSIYSLDTIKFRDLFEEDLDMILEWRNNHNVRSMMIDDHLISLKEHKKWYSTIKKSNSCKWFIVQYFSKDIGVFGLKDIDTIYNTCTWSMYLSDSMISSGVGVLVEIRAIDLMFHMYKIDRIWGELLSINQGLLRLHKKCGFSIDKIEKNKFLRNGKSVDLIKVSLESHFWKKKKLEFVEQFNLN
jgi:UDP-4-amino-4,6-dideoxy-N-acetyl-beta-L-altrosamine N-acetyltransferase